MKRELAKEFNTKVDDYRNSLLSNARRNDWETFDATAGKMFDYIESIECAELERRFFLIFTPILALLALAVVVLSVLDFESNPVLQRLKRDFILSALAGSGFELYFYLDYRMYLGMKTSLYQRRRENFIRGMEKDFQHYSVQLDKAA